ncbi:MAG: hypothetical protein M1834_005641 [Cirrosporium novae-zelandiae]|nr:MAG: hypothetical protein M1834_005641 [Cirrosporium novae-zelandiae]
MIVSFYHLAGLEERLSSAYNLPITGWIFGDHAKSLTISGIVMVDGRPFGLTTAHGLESNDVAAVGHFDDNKLSDTDSSTDTSSSSECSESLLTPFNHGMDYDIQFSTPCDSLGPPPTEDTREELGELDPAFSSQEQDWMLISLNPDKYWCSPFPHNGIAGVFEGDCGSLVTDVLTKSLFGMVVAGHAGSKVAYISSAKEVFDDIKTICASNAKLIHSLDELETHQGNAETRSQNVSKPLKSDLSRSTLARSIGHLKSAIFKRVQMILCEEVSHFGILPHLSEQMEPSYSIGGLIPNFVNISHESYVRPTHPRVKCPHYNEHPEGFRDEHELRRHVDRMHKTVRKVWVCVDQSTDKTFLASCMAFRNGKKYGSYYNAAAHLRRAHFNPFKRGFGDEKSGKKDPPSMDALKDWTEEREESTFKGSDNEANVPMDDTKERKEAENEAHVQEPSFNSLTLANPGLFSTMEISEGSQNKEIDHMRTAKVLIREKNAIINTEDDHGTEENLGNFYRVDKTSTGERTRAYSPRLSSTLHVVNLPSDVSEDESKALFSKQTGYRRLCFRIRVHGPICFVEFEEISHAIQALNNLYGHMLHNGIEGGIRLSFAKSPSGEQVLLSYPHFIPKFLG